MRLNPPALFIVIQAASAEKLRRLPLLSLRRQGVEKLVVSKMMVQGSNRRVHTVDRHAGMVRTAWSCPRRCNCLPFYHFLNKRLFPRRELAGYLRAPTRRQAARELGGGRGCELDQARREVGTEVTLFQK